MRERSANEPGDIHRQALLARLQRVRPKVLVLLAPAGFGKSILARQYLARNGDYGVCDCSGVRDDLDLARRVLPAMAGHGVQGRRPERRELLMGDGSASIAERVSNALEAWNESELSAMLFENAEHLATSPSAREFLTRLLADDARERSIVICSRVPLQMHLTRIIPPHEIIVLRANDLAFDAPAIRAIFEPLGCDERSIGQITDISRGWPVAVLVLRRLATEGAFQGLREPLCTVVFDELRDYLADEVGSSLDPRLADAIFACACIPHAGATDLRGVLSEPYAIDDIAAFAKDSPFVDQAGDGTFSVHPLMAALLLEHQEERRSETLRRAADGHEQAGRFQRAAQLYLARGDEPAAARALGRHEAARAPTLELDIASGNVWAGGRPIVLSGRELELLVAISLHREGMPRDAIASMLWPDLEIYAARNALSVCLHRLRGHLACDGAIVRDGEGYRLHERARVDFWEIERLASAVRARARLQESDRVSLARVVGRIRERRPMRLQHWEWFEATRRRFAELRTELIHRLAHDAFERGNLREALELANEICAADPCDEPSCEIAIRAHLALGDRPAALRQYRKYRDALMAELQCQPSASLADLIS